MSRRILVAGIGNIFLGDDGFGPEVVRYLAAEPAPLPEQVRLVDYGIRGLHLAYDLLPGFDALVLIDAQPGPGTPGDVAVLRIRPEDVGDGDLDAHGMVPVAVLASLPALGGELPPTFLVGCRPADTGEGIGLSEPVAAAVPAAADAVRTLVRQLVDEPALVSGGG